MIPITLMTKLEDTFSPLVMRIQGVRDVLVREAPPISQLARNEESFIVLVVIDDDRFAETSAVVLAVFSAFLDGGVANTSITLRMRPLRPDSLRSALGYGSEWHPCVKPAIGGTDAAQ